MQLFAQGNTKLEMRYVGTGYCAHYLVYTLAGNSSKPLYTDVENIEVILF